MTDLPITVAAPTAESPRRLVERPGRSDRLFGALTSSSGAVVLVIMVAVGIFLTVEAIPAFRARGFAFFVTQPWQPATGEFGIAAVLGYTIAIALVAVSIAVPVSLATSLFIVEVAPRWSRPTLIATVDLMAAVPSVVYGLWGRTLIQGEAVTIARWFNTCFGWIPLFEVTGADPTNPISGNTAYSASTMIAGVVVAMMVIPIQTSVMREVFSQVPVGEREGAFALGSTRWGMIRVVTLPFGRGGIIGGTMLGLGRALGETIAVLLIISPRFDFTVHLMESGSNSVSALIANKSPEASDFELSALFAAGVTLFAITLAVNFVASAVVARSRSGSSSEA